MVVRRQATDLLDSAERGADGGNRSAQSPGTHSPPLLTALRSLRSIDQAVVDLAHDLGAVQRTTDETAHAAGRRE